MNIFKLILLKGGKTNLKGKDQKKPYIRAELEISTFKDTDIVTASSAGDGPYSPDEDLGMWG